MGQAEYVAGSLTARTSVVDAAAEAGEFALPSPFEMLGELRTILAESQFTNTRMSCNHASNYVPMRMDLPQDRDAALCTLDRIIAAGDTASLKPEFLRGL